MAKPFTDEKLKRFLAMYDDKYSYIRISKISKRDVKDVRRIYDEIFPLQEDDEKEIRFIIEKDKVFYTGLAMVINWVD